LLESITKAANKQKCSLKLKVNILLLLVIVFLSQVLSNIKKYEKLWFHINILIFVIIKLKY